MEIPENSINFYQFHLFSSSFSVKKIISKAKTSVNHNFQ